MSFPLRSIRPLRSSLARFSTIFALSAALGLATGSAATFYWDGGTTNIAGDGDSASAGGAGTWDTTILNWDTGFSPHVAWSNVGNNDAVFAGAAGTVTLGTNISAGNLSLSNGAYTIATAAGASLTLTGGVTTAGTLFHQINGLGGLVLSGTQTFNNVGGLNVSTVVSGSDTVIKTGAGMVGFSGNNSTFTGKIVINTGRFGINGDAALGAIPGASVADSVTIDGGILVNGIPTNGTGSFSNGGAYTVNANRGIVLGGLGGTIQVGYGAAAGNFIAAGRLTIAGVVSGGALTKTDGGDLALLGDNTYAGGTTITGGGLFVGEITTGAGIDGTNSSLGTGAINVNGGQLVLAGNALTIANDITLNGAPTANNRQGGLVGGFQSGASANTLTGTLTLAGTGDRTISTWWSDKILTLGGKVTGTGNLRVVNIKADGSNQGGIIILSNAANDYSGNTIISGATNNPTLRLGASDVIPDGAGKGNVTVDGRLEVNGFTDTINGLSGSGVVSLGDGSLLIVGNNDATGTFSGILAGTVTGSLRKIGNGTLTLSGAADNSSGRARVDAGTLVLGKASSGAVHTLGSQGGADYALVVTGGTAQLGGTGEDQIYQNSAVNMTGGAFDFAGVSEGFDGLAGTAGVVTNSIAATTSTLTLGQNNSLGTPVFSGVIQDGTGTMALTKMGSGTQILDGASTYTGATTINNGSLQLGNGGTTGALSTNSAINNDGTLIINRSNAVVQGTDFSGSPLTGVGSFVQAGTGTTTLTAANTYSGFTNVNAGTLLVNGSIAGNTTQVSTGGTLGGTGTVGEVNVFDGILAPGVNAGTLNTGPLILDLSATLKFELAQAGVVGAGVNDLLSVTGFLVLDGTLNVIELPGFTDGTYRLINYTGMLNDFGLDLENSFLAVHPGSFVDTATAGQVDLVVVPEPGSLSILLTAAAPAFFLRRRRAQRLK